MSNVMEIVAEWFESDQMMAVIPRWMSENMLRPEERGTGLYVFGFPGSHSLGAGLPEGGAGALSEALLSCIKDNGGTVKVSSLVKHVKVVANEAKGVILDTGAEIMASKAIVSNLHVKQLFLDMLKPDDLPDGFPEKVKRIKQGNLSLLHQVIALNEAPKYKAGENADLACSLYIVPPMEDLIKAWDDCYHGVPFTFSPYVVTPTIHDPSRAPEGKHTLYCCHMEPYDLKDGGAAKWDEIKEEIADGVLETLRRHTTNMGSENILGRWIGSPLDYYRYNPSWIKGDFMHFPLYPTQSYGNRPLPGWGDFRTPVKKLYICGSSAHPGGGVWGAGRATAQVMMEDLNIDFRQAISK